LDIIILDKVITVAFNRLLLTMEMEHPNRIL